MALTGPTAHGMCADLCVDMRVDMRVDLCVDTCAGMRLQVPARLLCSRPTAMGQRQGLRLRDRKARRPREEKCNKTATDVCWLVWADAFLVRASPSSPMGGSAACAKSRNIAAPAAARSPNVAGLPAPNVQI